MKPNCPLEISVRETKRLLDTQSDQVLLIDVRETEEVAICRIAGARHIPMREIPGQLGALPPDQHLLIHCHHGGRSLHVTQFLRDHGFPRVSNVAGGIDTWAEEIEPGMERY